LPKSSDLGLGKFVILAIPFFAASEVLIGALQGIQRFHYRPLLRDLGVSAFLAPIALGLTTVGNIGPISLGIGFLAGHFLILSISVYAWTKETSDLRGGSLLPPRILTKYSAPIWLAESVNSANQRVTVLLLSRFAASSVVGAFGVISMVWQVATMMRRAFETPLVTITASSSSGEIRDLYKKVVQRVLVWQFPVVIALAAGGGSILRLISPGLGSVEHHLGLLAMVVCSYLASGPWMAQQILAGLGDSKRLLYSYALGALIGIVLLVALAPHLGIVGAGMAQGGAVIASGLLSAWQVKRYADLPGYPDGYLPTMGWTLMIASACTAAWLLRAESDSPWHAWPAWLLGLGVICRMAVHSQTLPESPRMKKSLLHLTWDSPDNPWCGGGGAFRDYRILERLSGWEREVWSGRHPKGSNAPDGTCRTDFGICSLGEFISRRSWAWSVGRILGSRFLTDPSLIASQ
jgi:O-antigen/teichoic acid export membrane protein